MGGQFLRFEGREWAERFFLIPDRAIAAYTSSVPATALAMRVTGSRPDKPSSAKAGRISRNLPLSSIHPQLGVALSSFSTLRHLSS